MSETLMGVPRWRWPLAEEPAHGLLLHLAELNGYPSMKVVAACFGLSLGRLKIGDRQSLSNVASLIRCPLETFVDSPVELVGDERVERRRHNAKAHYTAGVTVRGVAVSSDNLSRTERRACPACLQESRHHRFWWDLRAVTSCPRHGLKLANGCACGSERKMSWHDRGLFHCRDCGSDDPAAMPHLEAAADVLRADTYILSRFGVVESRRCVVLDDMSFADALDTMERVGAAKLAGLAKKWQSASSLKRNADEVQAVGFGVMADGQMRHLLESLFEQFRTSERTVEPALTSAYGWFYHWFNHKGGRNFSEEMSAEFLAHARDSYYVYRNMDGGEDGLPSTYSMDAAAKVCGISRTAMRNFGVETRMIRAEAMLGHVLVFEGGAVRKLAADLKDRIELRTVREKLGIEHKVLHDLLDARLIPLAHEAGGWTHLPVIRGRDVDQFVRDVFGEAPSVAAAPKELMSALDARRVLNLSGGLFIRLVVEKRVAVAARLAGAAGFRGILVDQAELRSAMIDLANTEDHPVPVAAAALRTSNQVLRLMIDDGVLAISEKNGRTMVKAKSFARLKNEFISLQEVVALLGCEPERVEVRLASVGITKNRKLSKLGFLCFPRSAVTAKIAQIRQILAHDFRSAI